MFRLIILILSLTAVIFSAQGQEKILVNGKITDKVSHEPVPFVHIIDKHKGIGVASNVDGTFSIKIDLGDTLIFSAVGYSRHSLVVTKQLREIYLQIHLDQETMELQTVKVFAYRDLAALKHAVLNMDIPPVEEGHINLKLPAVNNDSESSGIVVVGGLTSLLNGLGMNKEYNELKKLKKVQLEANYRNTIREKYNPTIVKQWLDLEEEKLTRFMEFCKLSDDFVFRATQYELAVAVNKCYDEFIKKEQD